MRSREFWLILAALFCARGPAQDQKDALALYARQCSPCHGERGRGDGPAGRFLDPTPRNFQEGQYRIVSTENGVPSDKDLFEVISAGMPGTAMLPFPQLSPAERWSLVRILRDFRRQGLTELLKSEAETKEELERWITEGITPGRAIAIPEPPPPTVLAKARGRLHYARLCSSCHGDDARGLPSPPRFTDSGEPIRPRNLTQGVLRGGTEPRNLFARIRCGMPGTPMPAVPSVTLQDDDVWNLVHYLAAIIPEGAQSLHDPVGLPLHAARIEGPLPTSVDDPRLLNGSQTSIALAPFRMHEATVRGLTVRAFHDGTHAIFRIEHVDSTRNIPSKDDASPPDGLAVRLAQLDRPPVLPIPGLPLPLDRALWIAGPMPKDDDPVFDGKDPRFQNPDSVCKAPVGPEHVGTATWRDGIWTVLMVVKPERAGSISERASMPVSFAAFDGALRRGPLPVAFSAWHRLTFE